MDQKKKKKKDGSPCFLRSDGRFTGFRQSHELWTNVDGKKVFFFLGPKVAAFYFVRCANLDSMHRKLSLLKRFEGLCSHLHSGPFTSCFLSFLSFLLFFFFFFFFIIFLSLGRFAVEWRQTTSHDPV